MVKRTLTVLLIACGGLGCGDSATGTSAAPAGSALGMPVPVATPPGTLMCPAVTTAEDLRRIDARVLVGRPVTAARDRAARGGCEMRVMTRDGRSLIGSANYRPDRVSVSVRSGVVVAVDGIG